MHTNHCLVRWPQIRLGAVLPLHAFLARTYHGQQPTAEAVRILHVPGRLKTMHICTHVYLYGTCAQIHLCAHTRLVHARTCTQEHTRKTSASRSLPRSIARQNTSDRGAFGDALKEVDWYFRADAHDTTPNTSLAVDLMDTCTKRYLCTHRAPSTPKCLLYIRVVGNVVEKLKSNNIMENTLILFTGSISPEFFHIHICTLVSLLHAGSMLVCLHPRFCTRTSQFAVSTLTHARNSYPLHMHVIPIRYTCT